ncbi:transcription elongation factor GreB [Nevskia ramosa]|uniref:transcription elongation factor GreB n=1 Tax=Nevskia ramosa TaxID=64002 RepID=UPI0003B599B6|nr:transcription elongation factor GreB [Nevskia ramosa]
MSRYREPPPKSSPYITAEGAARLRAEYEQLWRVRRPEVVRALSAAAAEGDRSENAEYIYRKKELREIDRRVHYLQLRLPELKVVDAVPSDPERVYFGAWLQVHDDHGDEKRYRIVGADEIDPERGYISIDSPLARALLKRRAGEVVKLMLPGGEAEVELAAVSYGPP